MSPVTLVAVALSVAPPAVDAHGHPIPPGAIARLGNHAHRFAHGASYWFTPDGKRVARVRPVGTDVRDVATGRDVTPTWLRERTHHFQFTPAGDVLVCEPARERCRVLDFATGVTRFVVPTPGRTPNWAQMASDGRRALVSWQDRRTNQLGQTLYELELDGHAAAQFDCPAPAGSWVTLAAGGRMLVTATAGTVRAYSADTGELVRETKVAGEAPASFMPCADDRYGVAVSQTKLRFFTIGTDGADELGSADVPPGVGWTALSPDGRTVTVLVGSVVWRYEFGSGKPLGQTSPPTPANQYAVLAPDGKTAAMSDDSGRGSVWDTATGRARFTYPDLSSLVDVRARDDGVAVTLAADQTLTHWDARTGRPIRSAPAGKPVPGTWAPGVLSADGRRVAVVSKEPTGEVAVRVSATDPAGAAATFRAHYLASFAPDGRRAVLIDQLGAVLADTETGRTVRRLPDHQFYSAWSADGRLLATGNGNQFRLIEVRTNRVRAEWVWHPPAGPENGAQFRELKFSRDGRRLAKFGTGVPLVVWSLDADPPRVLATAPRQGDAGFPFGDLSPDGRYAVYAPAGSGVLYVHDLTAAEPSAVVGTVPTGQWVLSGVTFSPDGRTLVTAAYDGTAVVWDWPRLARRLARPRPPVVVTPDELWDRLADPDGRVGGRAVVGLVRDPTAAVRLIAARLPPAGPPPADGVLRGWVRGLDDGRFPVRDAAERSLAGVRETAEPVLRAALATTKSAEQRERLDRLIARLSEPDRDPDRVRAFRAVEVLETVGTPDARAVLAKLAAGHPSAALTRDARDALDRLAGPRRATPPP